MNQLRWVMPLVCCSLIACGGASDDVTDLDVGGRDRRLPEDVWLITSGLPDSAWEGEATVSGSNPTSKATYDVTIQNNVVLAYIHLEGLVATTYAKFVFSDSEGVAWFDVEDRQVGKCEARRHQLTCTSDPKNALQTARTLSFFRERLVWEDTSSLQGATSLVRGTFARVP